MKKVNFVFGISFGLLWALIWGVAWWLAGTTPRHYLNASISHRGDFALTSWSKGSHDLKAEIWSADLKQCQTIPCEPSSRAISISTDGKTVTVPTKDEVVYFDVSTGRIQKQFGWRHLVDPSTHYGDLQRAFEGISILKNSSLLIFPAYDVGGVWQPLESNYEAIPLWHEPDHKLDWNRRFGLFCGYQFFTEKGIQRLYKFTDDGSVEFVREMTVEGGWYSTSVVRNDGAVVMQHSQGLTLIGLEGEEDSISIPSGIGNVQQFSPDGKRLLFLNRKDEFLSLFDTAMQDGFISIFDVAKRAVVARYDLGDFSGNVQFQDNDHLVVLLEPINADRSYDQTVNDQLIRWNWRNGKVQKVIAGPLNGAETQFWLRLVWAAFGIWVLSLVALTWFARPSDPIGVSSRPWGQLFFILFFMITVPLRSVWSGLGPVGANLSIAGGAIFAVISFAMFISVLKPGSWMTKLSCLLFLIAAVTTGYGLNQERTGGDPFSVYSVVDQMSVVLATFCILAVLFSMARWKGWRLNSTFSSRETEVMRGRWRIYLREIILLTTAVASLFAVSASADDFDLSLKNIVDDTTTLAWMSVVAAVTIWLGFGTKKLWRRCLFAGFVIVPSVYVLPLFTTALICVLMLSCCFFRHAGYRMKAVSL